MRQQCLRRGRTAHVPVDLYEPLIILHSRYCTEGPKSSPPKKLELMRKLLSFYVFQYDFAREVTRKFPIFYIS